MPLGGPGTLVVVALSSKKLGRSLRRQFASLDKVDQASVPLFVLTMVAEAAVLSRRPRRAIDSAPVPDAPGRGVLPADPLVPVGYEARDTATSLAMLVGNVAITFATLPLVARLDRFVFRRRITSFGSRRGAFMAAMVLWDFLYYWDHRWMHEVRLMWANHVTHHSSQRYNLSTALRQPWSGLMNTWIFMPMPLLGFPMATTAKAGQLNLLYQYWIHTEAIDRLPAPLERVLNTPSHHRVHHGTNPEYLDRNYGGILIVWDKLFGTFEPEVRRVRYGLTKNISTHNPLRVAYHEFADIVRDVRRDTRWRDRLGHVLRRPGWEPARIPATSNR